MNRLLVTLLIIAGCASGRYPIQTSEKYGVTLSAPHHLKVEQMEEMIEIAQRLWMEENNVPPASLQGYHVEILETPTDCGDMANQPKGKDGTYGRNDWRRRCQGVNLLGKYQIGLVEHYCWADTSLIHELLHYWIWMTDPDICLDGRPYDQTYEACLGLAHHGNGTYFTAANSIEMRGRAIALFDGVCGFPEVVTEVTVDVPPGHEGF